MADLQDLFKSPHDSSKSEPQYKWEPFNLGQISLQIRLLARHKLWGHYIWNAGKVAASLLLEHSEDWVRGKGVLEFGAGSALPSLVAGCLGASFVCSTDYDDQDLITNIQYNFEHNKTKLTSAHKVIGFKWGTSTLPLQEANSGKKYDLIILADLLFNHVAHRALLTSLKNCLREEGSSFALVTFTPHRPKLLKEDLNFFQLASEEFGFVVKELPSVNTGVMFEEDPGDATLRGTVFVYTMHLK